MKRALIVATIYNFISSFEKNNIQLLQEEGYEVWCGCNTEEADGRLDSMGVHIVHIPFVRSPFSKNNMSAYQSLVKVMRQERFDLLHCHTPVGGTLARLAASRCHIPKVLYTAHGFHFYKGAPKLNWLLYYPVEKWLSWKTDVLITINKEDYERAKRKFKAKQIEYVPGIGIDVEKNKMIAKTVDRKAKRLELGIPEDAFLLLSVGELCENKNHRIILEALSLKKDENVWYAICGRGILEKQLLQLAEEYQIEDKFLLLGYRGDVIDIMAASDVFVFPSKREGLPVALMEAMTVGLPVICSRIRGNEDLMMGIEEALLCESCNKEEYANKISELEQDPDKIERLMKQSQSKIKEFDVRITKEKMQNIYKNL